MIREFFWNVQFVLPCEMCRTHYAEMIRTHPPITKDRRSLVYWLIDRHNQVNKRLGKREYTYDEVLQKYQSLYNLSNKPNAILELSKDDNMGVSCSKNMQGGAVGGGGGIEGNSGNYEWKIKIENLKIPFALLAIVLVIIIYFRQGKKR